MKSFFKKLQQCKRIKKLWVEHQIQILEYEMMLFQYDYSWYKERLNTLENKLKEGI